MKNLLGVPKPGRTPIGQACYAMWCLVMMFGVFSIWPAGSSQAQTVTFDFDTGTPTLTTGQNLSFDQTAGGITAHFRSPQGSVFSIQNAASTGWTLSQFSGKFLNDNNLNRNALDIKFSQQLSSITLAFATADFNQTELPTTIQLTAYQNSTGTTAVGTASTRGTYASDTMPMGTLSFTSNVPFNLVEVLLPYQPLGVTDFLVDNITVTPIPKLAISLTNGQTAAYLLEPVSGMKIPLGTPQPEGAFSPHSRARSAALMMRGAGSFPPAPNRMAAGRTYSVLLPNPAGVVKSRSAVVVVIGDARTDNLTVE